MYAIRLSHNNRIHVWMVITRLRRGRIYRRTLKSRALPSIPMAVSLGKEWLAKCTKALLKEVPHLCKAVRKPTRLGAERERACAGVRCGACGAGRGVPRAARGICGPHLGTWCQAIRCGNMVRGGTGCGATLKGGAAKLGSFSATVDQSCIHFSRRIGSRRPSFWNALWTPWYSMDHGCGRKNYGKRSKAFKSDGYTKQQRAPLTTRRPHRSKDPASRGAFAFSHDKVRALYTLSQPTVRADWTADWTARRMAPSNACLRFCQNIEHKSEGFLPSSQRQRSRLNTPLPDQVLSCI